MADWLDAPGDMRPDTRFLQAGFRSDRDGRYVRDGIRLRFHPSCPFLEKVAATTAERPADPAAGRFHQPGFWKPVCTATGLVDRFDLPLAPGDWHGDGGAPPEGASNLESIISWAIETATGIVPPLWNAPQDAVAILPDEALVMQHGRFLQRAHVVREDQVLVVRTCLIENIPGNLDPRRLAWLRQTLLDAQARLRFVRFHLSQRNGHVIAEVDFRGAPVHLLPDLLPTGLAALRQSFKWLVASLDLLVNAEFHSPALDIPPCRDKPRKEDLCSTKL